MCIISSLTLLSTILGPPSALIGFADKFSDWMDEEKYKIAKILTLIMYLNSKMVEIKSTSSICRFFMICT